MNNTKRSPRPDKPTTKRKTQRSGLGCSLGFVAVLVGLVVALVVLGPRALHFLLANEQAATSATLKDDTSPEKLAAQRQKESAQLAGYGWVNQAAGIARDGQIGRTDISADLRCRCNHAACFQIEHLQQVVPSLAPADDQRPPIVREARRAGVGMPGVADQRPNHRFGFHVPQISRRSVENHRARSVR